MSLGGEDEFFKFIKFYEEGNVGTLIRLWNKFNKIYNDLSREGKYLLNLFKFSFLHFSHRKFFKIFRHFTRWGHSS